MRWIELTTTEFAVAREKAAGVALFPIGSIETHGPHLPVGTDALSAEKVADLAAKMEPVVVLPTLPYTWSPQARKHGGAITIPTVHLIQFVEDICDEVARNGFTKIVMLNGHGGNWPINPLLPMHMVERGKPYVLYSIDPWGGLDPQVLDREGRRSPIGHACHLETSALLYARPDVVKLENLEGEDWTARPRPDLGASHNGLEWIERRPYGMCGDPTLGTAELGRELLEGRAKGVAEIIRKVKADDATLAAMLRFPAG